MTLLQDIQSAAIDDSVSLPVLLRKCKILARRLKHQPLEDWVDHELNGYPSIDNLPPYRKYRTTILGNFVGPFNAQRTNVSIPEHAVDEKHRDALFNVYLTEGVASYEALLESSEDSFHKKWSAEDLAYYSSRLMELYQCIDAWHPIPRGLIANMVDQIRTRVLSFVLEIEEQNPAAGESSSMPDPPIAPSNVDQALSTNIFGDNNIIVSGSQNTIINFKQQPGDWPALERSLRNLDLPQSEIDKLQLAVSEDEADTSSEKPARQFIAGWVGLLLSWPLALSR